MSAQRFTGRVAVVTGAAQGIGKATALRLAAEGALVVIADRAEKPALGVLEEIIEAGGQGRVVAVDLEQREGAVRLFAEAASAYGRIDIAVHNVGGTIWAKPFWEYRPEEIEAEIQRSLWPTLWCCHAVLPHMLEKKSGTIVNIGSVATRGIYRAPYSAAKGGVSALTTALAMEVAEHGLRVNCVAPGGVDAGPRVTPRNPAPMSEQENVWMGGIVAQTLRDTPLARFGAPEELAAAICFFAADESSYVTGQTLYVAGGGIG
ncbi:MAG: 1,6-dihydroxycyclohexa-2,4-diene-1-carboxylate dehydrogenase [Alphaproteobacteria bacterium]